MSIKLFGFHIKNRSSVKYAALAAAGILAAGVLCFVLFRRASRGSNEVTDHTPTPSNAAESTPEVTATPSIIFRGMEIEVKEDVPVNTLVPEGFQFSEDGTLLYTCGYSVQGIDISSHQGDVDWQAVADSGIEFVMLRAAYRGYGRAGKLLTDDCFRTNVEGALNAGLDVGLYVFSQARDVREAQEEAEYLLALAEEYPIKYPLVYDWERVDAEGSRSVGVSNEVVTAGALVFCKTVEDAGYSPAVYINMSQGYLNYDLSAISAYPLWLAEYDCSPEFYYSFDILQYTCSGAVAGVQGEVDRNLCFRRYSD